MSNWITVRFFEAGVPKTGLSPTVTVRDLADNSVPVNAQAMTEVGDGFYKYDFTTRDTAKDYVFSADSVTLLGSERYATGAIAGEAATGFALSTELAKVPKSDGVVTWNDTAKATLQAECNDALVANNLDHVANSTGLVDITQTAADKVWGTSSRVLTAGTNITLAKGVGVTGFNDLSATDVNAEMVDVLSVDVITEPNVGIPPVTPTMFQAISWLWAKFKNKQDLNKDTGINNVYNSSGTIISKATITDDGTTTTTTKFGAP